MASKTDEGSDVARHFASPMVLRALVDKLASYRPPAMTGAVEMVKTSSYKYAAPAPAPEPASEPTPPEAVGDEAPRPPTVTEDLVIKLLACLMVHPQQGQRARLVLRDEMPEKVYMALHQAGSVPADIKGDSSKALPPLPHRDTDHKLYPKKGSAVAGAAGAGPALATGGARTPQCLENPISIPTVPEETKTAPVTVENVEIVAGEKSGEAGSEGSGSPKREPSLARSVVASLMSHRGSPESRATSVPLSSASGRDNGAAVSPGKAKGLWQRASASWAHSPLNPAYGVHDRSSASPSKVETVDEERPSTLSSPDTSEATKSRAASMRKLGTRLSPKPVTGSSTSPLPAVNERAQGEAIWGSVSVASSSPKPTDGGGSVLA